MLNTLYIIVMFIIIIIIIIIIINFITSLQFCPLKLMFNFQEIIIINHFINIFELKIISA